MGTVPQPCMDIHTPPAPQPSIPPWFAEVVLMAGYSRSQGLLQAFNTQVRFVRKRFGRYEVVDFLALLFGDAISRSVVNAPCKPSLTGCNHLPSRSWRS